MELIKSIEPSQRQEWAGNHVIGKQLFANGENVKNDGRGDERGGDPAAQSIDDTEGQDADQETARGQVAQLELSVSRDRQAVPISCPPDRTLTDTPGISVGPLIP